MVVYLLLLLVTVVVGILTEETKSKRFYVFGFAALFLMMACRSDAVGTDTFAAIGIFARAGMSTVQGSLSVIEGAPVYGLWCKFIYSLCPIDQAIIVANSFVICLGYGLFLGRFAKTPGMALILFLISYTYLNGYNTMRQELAVSLCMLSYVVFARNGRAPGVLLVLVAVGIHNTAIVFPAALLVSMLSRREIASPGRLLAIALIVGLVLRSIYEPISTLFMTLFPRFGRVYSEDALTNISQGRSVVVYLMFLLIFALWAYQERGRWKPSAGDVSIPFLLLAFLGLSLRLFFFDLTLMIRIASYLLPFTLSALANCLGDFDRKWCTVAPAYFTLSALIVVYIAMLRSNIGGVVPYGLFF